MAGLDLGKQVGPLPLGAWLVVVAGGLGIAWYTRREGSSPTVVDDTSSQPGVGDGSVGGWTTTSPSSQTDGSAASAPTTNEEWAYRATQYLISIGTNSATAQSATSKYIAEQQLSVTEYSMIQLALIHIGPLPQPLTNAGGTAPSTSTPVTMKAPTGLKISRADKGGLSIDWDPLPGIKGYKMYIGSKQVSNSVVYSNGYISGLKSNTSYTVGVAGIYPGDKMGPKATVTGKTAK